VSITNNFKVVKNEKFSIKTIFIFHIKISKIKFKRYFKRTLLYNENILFLKFFPSSFFSNFQIIWRNNNKPLTSTCCTFFIEEHFPKWRLPVKPILFYGIDSYNHIHTCVLRNIFWELVIDIWRILLLIKQQAHVLALISDMHLGQQPRYQFRHFLYSGLHNNGYYRNVK